MRVTAGIRALVLWLCVAISAGVALAAIHVPRSPLDDPHPGQQRPGYLDAVGERRDAPLVTISRPARGRLSVIFFVRVAQQQPLRAALEKPRALPAGVDVFLVGGRPDLTEGGSITSITDGDSALARAYDMPVSRDGGYPVGYAIVGPDGTIRYRTLDPQVTARLAEVRMILLAVS